MSILAGRVGEQIIFTGVGPQGAQGAQGTSGSAGGSTSPNNVTNNTFVGSGQIPALPGAMAANGQTATCTFGAIAMQFTVTVGTNYFFGGTCFASSNISSLDDPGGIFTSSPTGTGIYIFKSPNSSTISFRNLTGSSVSILVQAINSPITAATVWS